jgi:signal transduction histidine kinase
MSASRSHNGEDLSDAGRVESSPALLMRLERGGGDVNTYVNTHVPGWIEQLLRIPLPLKLVGANILLLVAAAATALVLRQRELNTAPVLAVVIVAFVAALLINTGLVMLAVRPIRVLEKTVNTLWRGDLAARVPASLLADRHVARVGRMFNILLDGLVADRARTRRLATELIGAADRERAAVARELHDSAAQSLAALVMQLGVASRAGSDTPREDLQEKIETARLLATSTLEEVRLLAHTMHPRVLDDLGLVAALRRLARENTNHLAGVAESGNEALVEVITTDGSDETIPAVAASVLYRVAQEAVNNARHHASASRIEIRLQATADIATLQVVDDGCGFDSDTAPDAQTGIGLFTMRERVSLVEGKFQIRSRTGFGTSVIASIPVHSASSNFRDGQRL